MIESELSEALDLALQSLLEHPDYRLLWSNRARIWKAMEPRHTDENGVASRIGQRRRVRLAMLCTQKVLQLWEAALPENRLPHKLLTTAREYLEGKVEYALAWERKNEAWAFLESLLYTDQIKAAMGAGFAAAATLAVAVYDENFDPDDIGDSDTDRAADLYDWDAALFASLAYSRESYVDEPLSRLLRKDFWEWYLKEAVPAAYQLPI